MERLLLCPRLYVIEKRDSEESDLGTAFQEQPI